MIADDTTWGVVGHTTTAMVSHGWFPSTVLGGLYITHCGIGAAHQSDEIITRMDLPHCRRCARSWLARETMLATLADQNAGERMSR